MVNLNDIHPVSGFVRDPKGHIKRLRETGRPEVLTVNGEARVVVQDVAAYQKLLEALEDANTLRVLREGLASIERGEPGVPAEQAFQELRGAINRQTP